MRVRELFVLVAGACAGAVGCGENDASSPYGAGGGVAQGATGGDTAIGPVPPTEGDAGSSPPAGPIVPDPALPAASGSFVDERDGRSYRWVRLGGQVWMAENLAFNDGREGIRTGEGEYASFLADGSINYGLYYTRGAAMGGEPFSSDANPRVRGICPAGWHLPNVQEAYALRDWVAAQGYTGREGLPLRSTSSWEGPQGQGLDVWGFNAKPSGIWLNGGGFWSAGKSTGYWTSTLYVGPSTLNTTQEYNFGIGFQSWKSDIDDVYIEYMFDPNNGPVRCVQDA